MSMADTLAIVLALAAQSSGQGYAPMDLPPAAAEVIIEGSNGGAVNLFANRVIDYDQAGTHVRIMGPCVSACTLVLALPANRVCVGPRASFGFHQPSLSNKPGLATTDLGTAMMDTYPPFVRQWLTMHYGGMPSGRPVFMGYDLLRRYYPTCA
jgi:hypothetical protein